MFGHDPIHQKTQDQEDVSQHDYTLKTEVGDSCPADRHHKLLQQFYWTQLVVHDDVAHDKL